MPTNDVTPTRSAPGRRSRRHRRLATGALAVVALIVLATGCVIDGTWAATPPLATIPASTFETPTDVSCVSEDWCMLAGIGPIVEIWDGTSWSTGPQLPVEGDEIWASISDVDCGAPDSCLVRARRYLEEPGPSQYLLGWDGTAWTQVVDHPVDAFGLFTTFSCVDSGECVIADDWDAQNLIWDGGIVATTPWSGGPPNGGILSCSTTSACLSIDNVGETSTWNGSAWSPRVWPVDWRPGAVSCVSTTSCVGVGREALPGTAGVGATWNGSTWSLDALPATTQATWSGLSCASASECVAVAAPPYIGACCGAPAQVTWNGEDWFVAPTPPGGADAAYRGISCLPLWCMAVGEDHVPQQLVAATYTWTNS